MRVFLLEDEYALRVSIEEFLEDLGYEVESFESGADFFDRFFQCHCDLILLDVKVPGVDGFTLLREIREAGSKTPAIFITSLTHVDDLAKGFELGCCDYIKKPFDLRELQVRMEHALRRECFGSVEERIDLGDGLWYDTRRFELVQEDQILPLTRQERRILELLLQHRGQVLPVERICEAVWGEYVDGANVRVHINRLRKKLGKERIKTIHGVGYRLDS
ncbi:MAG: DNA-binding response regulator [Nitratiruptor sp.]|nr:DNA-binding response regulator [Nitratiruptor sp.]NPA83560.1 response regulator transcription factor [Campylobacterota bacterium]